MKTYLTLAALILCAATAKAEIVFQGYMTSADQTFFVVSVDKDKTSGWLARGQKFEGVSIVAFDAKTELLTVEKDGKQQTIHLVGGKTQAASDAPARVATKPILILLGNNESISVGDDVAMLEALKKKFELVAKMQPQPTITIQAPSDARLDRLSLIMDLLRKAGITRFDVSSQ